MIVVDASALVEILQRSTIGAKAQEKVFGTGRDLHAPHLIDVEIAHVLRRLAAAGAISGERGRSLLALLSIMPISRHDHGSLLARAWELRFNVTAYDAMYVALATALDAPVLTHDRRLANAVENIIEVELI